jgi:hypothetical protein
MNLPTHVQALVDKLGTDTSDFTAVLLDVIEHVLTALEADKESDV